MIKKALILYSVLLYLFHSLELFKNYQRFIYSDFYVSNKLDTRSLIYSPYDFSDVRNILMSICITPYGLTLLMLSFMTILFGYISNKWYIFFIFIVYILLIISHYLVYTKNVGWIPYIVRILFFSIPILKITFSDGGSIERKAEIKKYGQDNSSAFIVILMIGVLNFIVSYNYTEELGEYTIKNEKDYRKIYTPKWIFVSFIIPIYLYLYFILTDIGVTNTFVKSFVLGFIFILFSYIFY